MKTLFIDASLGLAGDMLTAALLELFDEPDRMLERLNAMGIPGVHFEAERVKRHAVTGTHMHVFCNGAEETPDPPHSHHHEESHGQRHVDGHMHLQDVAEVIAGLRMPEEAREAALRAYTLIAEAESKVHGESMEHIHFHELGTMDAIADVCAACFLVRELGADRVVVSPVRTGFGIVHCAHGPLPVPAPATALLLRGLPSFAGDLEGELCTPTGVALVKTLATDFDRGAGMITEAVGYGMGNKDFGRLTCVRTQIGEEYPFS